MVQMCRRTVAIGIGSAISTCLRGTTLFGRAVPRVPNPDVLESGDFLWPKKPGMFVPYTYREGQDAERDQAQWESEKKKFLERAARRLPELRAATQEIQNLNYSEFRTRYLRGQGVNDITPYSSDKVRVLGHVAIVERDQSNRVWIIEALYDPGVVKQLYADWIKSRPGDIVWHGRLKAISRDDRNKIAVEAKRHLSKPYDFWNFDLLDDSSFYCSKLAWLSTFRSIKVALDGDSNPKRSFWLSPKQILYASRVERLLDPGDYATD